MSLILNNMVGFGAGGGGNTIIDHPSLMSGLLAYWELEDLTDSSGNGKTLTKTGTVNAATGKIDNGHSATWSSSNYLSNTSVFGSNLGTGNVTLAAWMLQNGQSNQYNPTIVTVGTLNRVYLTTTTTNGYAGFYGYDGATLYATSTTQVSNNAWHHIVGVRNGTSVKIYVDGAEVGSTTGTAVNVNATAVYLGTRVDANDSLGSATLDEVGVWNRALTAAEITDLYNGGLGRPFS